MKIFIYLIKFFYHILNSNMNKTSILNRSFSITKLHLKDVNVLRVLRKDETSEFFIFIYFFDQ